MISVVTAWDAGREQEFARLRRRKWAYRDFLAVGEWSQSPYHQGFERFHVRATADRRCWALLTYDFPKRVTAVAEADGAVSLEEAAAEMMAALLEAGGPYIEFVSSWGDVDREIFWSLYDAAREKYKAKKREGAKDAPGGRDFPAPTRERKTRQTTTPAQPVLPPDAVLACTYDLNVGVDNVDEEAWFRRAEGTDELWTRCLGSDRKVVSEPSADEPPVAARRLLERSIRGAWGFQGPTRMLRPGLVTERDLEEILATINAEYERRAAEARSRESRIVEVARELGLSPEPTGTGPTHWQAHCPGTGHQLLIGAESGTFGCGWCKRKGGEAELRAFVEERRRKDMG